ncbi:diguanylate cyclase [Luteimonas sp. MC1572]|uniref:diguanylate cyclase n=1 Tax=Luteimonas sp. MC1572 TaxID=2799325 RepID=UPI0018F083B4|nr:diguanylate cyclase [Luteimonas sp. MC1572]MBJ6980991.1 GGDEF domain-containing protein [Luteimonas sp. MC1572]QQO02338.1 GGDEF domain-containing protein [Luteimonas sp. MC1572]
MADLRSGGLDDRLGPPSAPVIQTRRGDVTWWRVTTAVPLAPDSLPQLVLRSPFLNHVQAWVPGSAAPVSHALYGEHADSRYSHRALVVDLPQGIPAGEAVWLRVDGASSLQMPVSIESLDQVHRHDLAFVAWRVFVLSVLSVLVLLAFAFRVGTGDASFAWFGAMLFFAVLYLVSISGDLRLLPGADTVFGGSSRANRVVGGLGVVCSNLFQRAYLDLRGKLPALDRLLWVGTALAAVAGVGSMVGDAAWLGLLGNIGLMLSAALLLVGSTMLALRGDRAGRVVMASWLPLMVFTTLMATEVMGLWAGPTWLVQGLAGSFAVAGLLLTIGLADKLMELRRDRDHASARARADELTGMLNRAGVESELRRAVQQAGADAAPASIAFVDVDNFKMINDAYGHSIGDQCLRIVSQRIRSQLRGDEVIGRYGGDEFLVVLPKAGLDDALAVARRMLASVNGRPLAINDLRLDGSLSIGVAELVAGETAEALVERADAALYASKQAGRNRVTGAASDGMQEDPPGAPVTI